jgi:hypothetical protein
MVHAGLRGISINLSWPERRSLSGQAFKAWIKHRVRRRFRHAQRRTGLGIAISPPPLLSLFLAMRCFAQQFLKSAGNTVAAPPGIYPGTAEYAFWSFECGKRDQGEPFLGHERDNVGRISRAHLARTLDIIVSQ